MEPLIDLYRLPPPWGQLDRENQPQIHTVDDGTPTLPYANGRPVLDVSHESEDDDFGTLSIDERVAKLRQVHQQLMHTWAVVCPDKLSEIQAINDSVQNLAVAQPLSSDLGAMASVSVANPSGNVLGTQKLEMTQHTFDEAQHSQPISDIGPYSINTPSFRGICSWPGPIHQGGTLTSNTCSTASTSVTYMHTISQPKMSIHSDTHAKVPVSGSGSAMIEETSLHGKIWIPTAQSTPITLPAVTQSVTSSTSLGSRYAQHLAGWTLVSCDQPQENATSSLRQSQGIDPFEAQLQHPVPESVQNPQPLPFDVWVKQLQPVLHQAFEAGMHWGTSGSRVSSSGFGQSVPVGELLSGVCVNQGGMSSDRSCPTPVSDGVSFGHLPQSAVHMGQFMSRPSILSGTQDDKTSYSSVSPRVHFSDVTSDTLPSSVVPSGVGQESAKQSELPIGTTQPSNYRPKKVAKFDGKSSWADYLVQFNIAAKLNGWDESQKAMELATSLEGSARSILADLKPEHRLDFKSLIDKLTQRFEPEGQVGIYQSQLLSRKRKRNETIPELVQDISRLARKAYPAADEQTRSYMAVSSFISALGSEPQELFVYQKEPRTLEEAGKAALSFETFQAARGKESAYVRTQQLEKSSSNEVPQWARQWMSKMESLEKRLTN